MRSGKLDGEMLKYHVLLIGKFIEASNPELARRLK